MNPDKHCRHCGTKHSVSTSPQTCDGCGILTWHNPTPVVVVCQPVIRDECKSRGVLIGRRTIDPFKGQWNLIGGYVDLADGDYRQAGAREFFEETGIKLDPQSLHHFDSYSDGKHLLQFMRGSTVLYESEVLEQFVPNDECDAIRVMYGWENPFQLCFHSHERVMREILTAVD